MTTSPQPRTTKSEKSRAVKWVESLQREHTELEPEAFYFCIINTLIKSERVPGHQNKHRLARGTINKKNEKSKRRNQDSSLQTTELCSLLHRERTECHGHHEWVFAFEGMRQQEP